PVRPLRGRLRAPRLPERHARTRRATPGATAARPHGGRRPRGTGERPRPDARAAALLARPVWPAPGRALQSVGAMAERFPTTPRAPLAVRIAAVVLTCAASLLAGRAIFTSAQWVGRGFPGFMLLDNRVVAS